MPIRKNIYLSLPPHALAQEGYCDRRAVNLFKGKYVEVALYESYAEFDKGLARSYKEAKMELPAWLSDARALSGQTIFYDVPKEGPIRIKNRKIAHLYFVKDEWSDEDVYHEVSHLVLALGDVIILSSTPENKRKFREDKTAKLSPTKTILSRSEGEVLAWLGGWIGAEAHSFLWENNPGKNWKKVATK